MPTLDLVPLYLVGRSDLPRRLVPALEREFRLVVRVRRPWFEPEVAFDSSRGQYNSTVLLRQLLDDPGGAAQRVLGVTGVDLFTPVLTFVFGEAQLDGRAAIVSIHRLRTELYGLPEDEDLLYHRLEKEAIHELGHTYGLLHCRAQGCAMHPSTYVEEIDLKGNEFCDSCVELVRRSGSRWNRSEASGADQGTAGR